MRSACFGWLVAWSGVLVACGTVERTPFRASDDLVTATARNPRRDGHSLPVSLPTGIRFNLDLAAVRETPRKGVPAQRFELLLTVSCTGREVWAADVHNVELVDDEGLTLRPAQVLRRSSGTTGTSGTAPTTSHLLIFELPFSYRLRQIGRVTVHWALTESLLSHESPRHPPLWISSSFRR